MSTHAGQGAAAGSGQSGAGARRTRYGLSTLVLVAAASVVCLLGAVLASRHAVRWDVTATRQFSLSPRTLAVLRTMPEKASIVVSAGSARLDAESPGARRRVTDLLTEMQRATTDGKLAWSWIDTGSASGRESYARVIAQIAASRADELSQQRAVIENAANAAAEVGPALGRVSDLLKKLAQGTAAEELERQAGLVRTVASRVEPAAAALKQDAAHAVEGVNIPAADEAKERGVSLEEAARVLAAVADYAQKREAAGGEGAADARTLRDEARAGYDLAARAADELARLRLSDPLAAARIMQAGDAALVTGPRGTLAIDFASLFPRAAAVEAAAAGDVLSAAESLFTTALAGLSDDAAPVAIFVHAENGRITDESGLTAAGRRAFAGLFERLRLSNMQAMEWPVATQAMRPTPPKDRRAVWVVLGAPSRGAVDPRQPSTAADRAARINKLADALSTLIAAGESVLVSLDASDMPGLGEPDPVAAALEPLGVRAMTGFPLLRSESTPRGPATITYQVLRDAEAGHAIASAVRGVSIVLPWATELEVVQTDGVTHAPLLRVPAAARAWGESEWVRMRETVARGGTRPLDALLLADPPTADAARDRVRDPASPQEIVAAAIERSPSAAGVSGEGKPQRVVIVASPAWFDDAYTQAAEMVSGRRALLFPGNLELFEASVRWLAGQDERIAPGPQSRDVPRIGAIPPGTLTAVRWLIVAGLPVLVLIVGAGWRVLRG